MKKPMSVLACATTLVFAASCGLPATPSLPPTPAPTLTLAGRPPTGTAIPVPTLMLPSPTPEATATPFSHFAPVTQADWQRGPADARVTIVEYADFQ